MFPTFGSDYAGYHEHWWLNYISLRSVLILVGCRAKRRHTYIIGRLGLHCYKRFGWIAKYLFSVKEKTICRCMRSTIRNKNKETDIQIFFFYFQSYFGIILCFYLKIFLKTNGHHYLFYLICNSCEDISVQCNKMIIISYHSIPLFSSVNDT